MSPADQLPLRDIHLPDPVSWWPPAIGWWFLLLFGLVLFWLIIRLIKYLRKPVLKKSAKAELDVVITAFGKHQNNHLLIQQLSILLRRVGISYLPRNGNAGVSGIDWYNKINQLVEKNQLSEESIDLLCRAAYQQTPDLDKQKINNLIVQTQQWVSSLSREKSGV